MNSCNIILSLIIIYFSILFIYSIIIYFQYYLEIRLFIKYNTLN